MVISAILIHDLSLSATVCIYMARVKWNFMNTVTNVFNI